jgi:magnesium transporter
MTNHRRHRRRLKPRIRRRSAPGTKPGTLSIAPGALPPAIDVIAYSHDRFVEQPVKDPRELGQFLAQWPVVWVNVVGLGNADVLSRIAQVFGIHLLALEDVVNVHQRAKVDPYENNVFCVLRIPDPSNEQLTEQFSLFLGKNYVVTFQERPGDCFDLIRAGLRQAESTTRHDMRPDYLAYRLIDAAIDAYFPVVERIGDQLDVLDDRATSGGGDAAFAELHVVKRELLMLRRAIWPLRDALSLLRSEATPFISDQTRVYFRDCYDHAVQLIDLLESYRDICGDVRDFYLSSISNRMNEVMKTLTVIATLFMPLSFIAALYGMNFNPEASPWNMPELNWRWGYPAVLALMGAVVVGMFLFFRRRGWLQRSPSYDEPPHYTGQPVLPKEPRNLGHQAEMRES